MKRYLDIARRDLESAKIMLDSGFYNNSVRFCQQYAEKLFKHKIQTSGSGDGDVGLLHSHRIQKLANRVCQLTGIEFSKDELLMFSDLTSYYYDTNYPGDEYVDVDEDTAKQVYQQTVGLQLKYERLLTELDVK